MVARPRLLRRLQSGAESPVFVITAPAGYGKSTLMAQAVAGEHRAVAWITLDPRDDDPIVLLHDLAHALGRVAPVDDVLATLAAGTAGVMPVILPRLLSWLEDLETPVAIAFDDVHHLQRRESLDIVRVLCAEAPAGTAVYLASRTRPPVPLAKLRADGRLWKLGGADLRMTAAEGTAMLRSAGAAVDDREGALVVDRTEGWPAAIYLAALMLRDPDDAAAPSLGPSEADIGDYFREEVLASAAPEDADFLVRTAILDELDPVVCDAVLEGSDAAGRLRALTDQGLFVTAPSGAGPYRVHQLFREMLAGELADRHRGEIAALHRRAATAYRELGDWERAVRHALAGEDPETAADIAWQLAPAYASSGRGATLTRWRGWFTDEQVVAHPHAALGAGWAALQAGDADLAAHCASLALGDDRDRALAGGVKLVAMGLLLRASLGQGGLAQVAADAGASLDGMPPDHPLRAVAGYLLASEAMHAGDADRAREILEESERLAAGVLPTASSLALTRLALLEIDEGRWERADALSRRARGFQRAAGVDDYAPQSIVLAVHALVRARMDDDGAARRDADHAARTIALTRDVVPWQAREVRAVLAWAYALLGEGGRARALLDEVRRLPAEEASPLIERRMACVRDVLAGAAGAEGLDLTTAELRTLQYLPTHLSLREIGERLFVTRNTVKTHTIAIYRKLGVTSRSEAVARGRELGLLDG